GTVEARPFLGEVVEPQLVEGAAGLEEVGAGLAGGWIWWPWLVGWPSVDGVHVPVFFLPVFSAAGVSHTSPSASPSEHCHRLAALLRGEGLEEDRGKAM